MKTAMVLFRVVSILVLLACLLTVSGASASNKIPVNQTICARSADVVVLDPLVLLITWDSAMVPEDGPNGKQGFDGDVAGQLLVRIKPNSTDGDANIFGKYEFTGRIWEAGVSVWNGRLNFLEVGSGGPTNASGLWKTLDSRVHFNGRFAVTPEAAARCQGLEYAPGQSYKGGDAITGELQITPAR